MAGLSPASEAPEELLFLGVELGLADSAAFFQPSESFDLAGDVWGGRGGTGHPVVVVLGRLIDEELDVLRFADIADPALTPFPGRLDQQITGAEESLERTLSEGHVVDPFEWDLSRMLSDHSRAGDEPVARQDEMRETPPEEREDREIQDQRECSDRDDVLRDGWIIDPVVRNLVTDNPQGDAGEEPDERRHHSDPVRLEIEDEFLVVGKEVLREGHEPTLKHPRIRLHDYR